MSQTPFHPIVEAWFNERFGEPTEPQRKGWPEIAAGRNTLIAAPTGSGKTLAAFLVCIDRLLRQALSGHLPDLPQVVYVSPLKALSNDIRRNLEGPLAEIQQAADRAGHRLPKIRAQVRTGDTPSSERARMLKKPPHILVTTPESLYLLLTAPKSREILRNVKTVIVDEIHALARDKRGSHTTLTLERLAALCPQPPVRIGLSATQKPMDEIAHFLVGTGAHPDCAIIDSGHIRELDLNIEVPASDLQAVCSNEQWGEIYKTMSGLIDQHRSTLIFVNTRRMAERVSHNLRQHLGDDAVASHHGSLAREIRLSAEERLKNGQLKAIVATASLELGIDIGYIDLVCQIGSPRSIATFLQRVGRSGHRLGVRPKGRLFALTRDEALEGLALLRAVRQGHLDRVIIPKAPLDILEQQIVAEVSAQDWSEDELFKTFRQAWPYRDLPREEFDRILALASEGVATGRTQGAYIHRDRMKGILRGRRSARLTAITCGGAIPETADYKVVTEDTGTVVGTVNEDFAIESLAGDVFILGNTSWRIRYVRGGQVVVMDAEGAPASIPFWLGEAPGRTIELSAELARFRQDVAERTDAGSEESAISWVQSECGVSEFLARQAVLYVTAQKVAVGFVPTQDRILFERFFDESGGMQLVVHAPYGSRINRAWGLAMRKRFCRTFDFELQASADDNGIVLSLGPQHSFPLEEMFKMLQPQDAREHLIQALLASPIFQLRWRWNITRALAVLRFRSGKKVPPPLQRFKADDLLTAVFPLQTACFEHRPPDVPVPDHPLVAQTVYDCLTEAMDVEGWEHVLTEVKEGRVKLEARDTREPSPFSHSILNANPYSFLDDAPLEERRARAVTLRRTLSIDDMRNLAKLDMDAIVRVSAEAWPVVRDAEELHDALLSMHALPQREGADWKAWFDQLADDGRAALAVDTRVPLWIAAERWPVVRAALEGGQTIPALKLPAELDITHDPSEARVALLRGRLAVVGPVTAEKLANDLGLSVESVNTALARLEAEGFALQGRFTEHSLTPDAPVDWCERRLLARIHRLTLEGARRRVQPVSPEIYWRFLAEYHHLLPQTHREGSLGLHEAVGQLQGFEIAAGAWEPDILGARVEQYQPDWLDQLSFSGELTWGRMQPPKKEEEFEPTGAGLTRVVPISLAFRADLPWLLPARRNAVDVSPAGVRPEALKAYNTLKEHGASFFDDLERATGLLPARLEDALSELAALGLITADGFASIRHLVGAKKPMTTRQRTRWRVARSYSRGGRWTMFPGRVPEPEAQERLEQWAWQLLRRYGIVFRDLLTREAVAPSWWELVPVYRKFEARGELRGGRFVSGVAGEQYALPEAVESLRRPRDEEDSWTIISGADPLNLSGIVTPGARVPATRGNRLLFHNGRLAATLQAGEIQIIEPVDEAAREKITRALRLTQLPQLREELLKELAT